MLAFLYAGLPVALKLAATALIWRFPVDAVVQAQGYRLVATTHNVHGAEDELALYRRFLQARWFDAHLVVRTRRDDARVALLQEAGAPFVTYGRTVAGAQIGHGVRSAFATDGFQIHVASAFPRNCRCVCPKRSHARTHHSNAGTVLVAEHRHRRLSRRLWPPAAPAA
jgi:hypothetical protein